MDLRLAGLRALVTGATKGRGAFKAAIVHYTQGLAQSLASKQIRANSVSPGNTYFANGVWNQIEHSNPSRFLNLLKYKAVSS